MRGRTPGKRIAGVRLVTREGDIPGAGALLLRNIFRLLDSLPVCYLVGLATVVFTEHHVRVGDLAAGTLLVMDHDSSRELVRKHRGGQERLDTAGSRSDPGAAGSLAGARRAQSRARSRARCWRASSRRSRPTSWRGSARSTCAAASSRSWVRQ